MKAISKRARQISPSPTLALDAKAKAMMAQGLDVISFAVGEPDFNTPDHIGQAGIEAINQHFTRYTDASGLPDLKKAVCNRLKINFDQDYQPNQIVVSNGAKHSLYNAFAALLDDGDEVILPTPCWVSYTEQIRLLGGVPVFVETKEENDFVMVASELKAAITPKTKVLLLNSPSNPTGGVYSKENLQAIADLCVENDIYVIADEIYAQLLYDGRVYTSIVNLGEEIKKRTIVINGVSKSYAMTGWRIGYTACDAGIAKVMGSMQSHITANPCNIAQKAAVTALNGPQESIEAMRVEFEKRRNYLVERVNAIPGLSCRKPGGAFYVFANVKGVFGKTIHGVKIGTSTELCDLLLNEAKVAIVPGVAFEAEGYMRFSYATSMKNIKEGLDRVEALLKEAK
ncbi:MAG: pyridoxal phosphate-dependent aminotransferase [Candidatus Riflebacteria bacterium]|nr:pyridoxal phosphate-dependent aminotransferase [Candidatus Riflebacteria bacterium]